MGNWINTKFNDFTGIMKDTLKSPLGSFEEIKNFDLRDKTGELALRKGYDYKYQKISSSILSTKKISNLTYLKATSFWVDDEGGREIIVQFTKQRVAAQTTLTPNYFDMLGIWIRPYFNGTSWVDDWHWLNEIIITKISTKPANDTFGLYLQLDGVNQLKNWSIAHFTGTDYTSPNEISQIYYSEDDSYQIVKIYNSSNTWAVNDKVIVMRNYYPLESLNSLHADIVASDIVFHKVLDELRIGFGGYENRLAMSIGFRSKYFLTVDPNLEEIYYNGMFLDPYNIISDFNNDYKLTVSQSSGGAFPASKIYYKVIALLDDYQRFEILSGDYTPTVNYNLIFPIKALFGVFNKRLTGFEIYLSENENTSPFYLVKSITLASDEVGVGLSRDNNGGYIFENTIVTYANFTEATQGMPSVLGYSLPTDYVRSWDHAEVINGRTYLFNCFTTQRYENKIFYSERSGASANMPDVACNSFFDVENFDGDAGLALAKSPNDYLGVWSDNKFQLLNTINGLPLGLGTIYKGTVSKESIVNLGQELIWCSEYDIVHNRGYQITDVSKGTIRGDYRAISDKNKIVAIREEKGNCYRFYDGNSNEYILTERGWIKWNVYNKPTNYILRKNGDVWFMKDGDIYYQNEYQDRKDAGSYSSIPFALKSMPIDIRLLDAQIKHTESFYVHAFYLNCTRTPLAATFSIYLDGELYSSKIISQLSDMFYRIPQGAVAKDFQFELTGNGYEEFKISSMGIIWKPKAVGAIHGRNY